MSRLKIFCFPTWLHTVLQLELTVNQNRLYLDVKYGEVILTVRRQLHARSRPNGFGCLNRQIRVRGPGGRTTPGDPVKSGGFKRPLGRECPGRQAGPRGSGGRSELGEPSTGKAWPTRFSLFGGLCIKVDHVQKLRASMFIWEKVIPVSEKIFRQVYKRDLASYENSMKSYLTFI